MLHNNIVLKRGRCYFYHRRLPSIDKDTHGFDGQKERPYILKDLANTQSIPCGLFVVWPPFCSGKTALHLTAMDFRVIFGF